MSGQNEAAAGGSPAITLISQSPWVSAADPHFALRVHVDAPGRQATQVTLSIELFRKLLTRSDFAQTLSSLPRGSALDRSGPFTVASLPGPVAVDVPVTTGRAGGRAALDLGCTAGTGTCSGVYPLVVNLQDRSSGQVLAHLTTYLTFAEAPSNSKLRFAWVVPFRLPTTIDRAATSPTATHPHPSTAGIARLTSLVEALTSAPGVPVTVLADPRTVQGAAASGSAGQKVVASLARLSTAGTGDQFPPQPYVPIDLGAQAAAGLTGEPVHQMLRGASVLAEHGFRTVQPQNGPDGLLWPGEPVAWFASASSGTGLGTGLHQVGATQVVVPEGALASTQGRFGITQTFGLQVGRGAPVEAAVADSGLSAHFSDRADPVLAANQMLADLAMIESEAPNARSPRGVVAVPPKGWDASASFVSTLLHGLQGNPDVEPVTVSEFFAQVQPGGYDNEPTVRRASGGGPAVGAHLAGLVSTARTRLDGFDYAVVGTPPVLGELSDLLLAAEASDQSRRVQAAALATFERLLGGQLALVQLATDRTITLTSRTGPIPVTFLSSAPYGVRGTVQLSSDKLQFPQGSVRSSFVVARPTNPLRMVVEARTSGDLPLHVVLTAPRADPNAPPLVIAHGVLTVRATATSVVGIVLTLAAIAVLVGWWARTWWHRRKERAGSG